MRTWACRWGMGGEPAYPTVYLPKGTNYIILLLGLEIYPGVFEAKHV